MLEIIAHLPLPLPPIPQNIPNNDTFQYKYKFQWCHYEFLPTDKVPLSKGLLLVLSGLTVMLTLLPQYQGLFTYNLQAITGQQQVGWHRMPHAL